MKHMHTKVKTFSFESIMSSKFLFYAWIDLKNNKNYLISTKYKKCLRKNWFKHASYLISKSNFKYQKSFNNNSLTFLKNKIIENAILIYINSFFKINNSNFNSFLTEFVRELTQ